MRSFNVLVYTYLDHTHFSIAEIFMPLKEWNLNKQDTIFFERNREIDKAHCGK